MIVGQYERGGDNPEKAQKSERQPLQVDGCGGQERLDAHVLKTASDCARESMPSLCLPVVSFGAPTMSPVELPVLGRPVLPSATRSKERRMMVAHHDSLVSPTGRQAQVRHRATAAVLGFRVEEAPVLGQTLRPQDLASGALQDVVLGVVPKATEWDRRADWLGLGRDHGMDVPLFHGAIDLAVGVARVGGDRGHRCAGPPSRPVHLLDDVLALVQLPGGDLHVEDDTALVVHGGVLLISRLKPAIAAVRGHRSLGIGGADFLEFTCLAAALRGVVELGRVRRFHGRDVPHRQALPGYIGADQGGVDVHDLSSGDLRHEAGLNCSFEDAAETISAPTLAYAG